MNEPTTLTVGEVIDVLSQFDKSLPLFIVNYKSMVKRTVVRPSCDNSEAWFDYEEGNIISLED